MTLSHHLAAVWFADVVGYTRLSEENEGEAVRLVHGFQRVAKEVVAGYGGRVVKFLGDGALAEFPSTDMAVRSAEALIRAFAAAAEAEGLASDELRIGVHVGDVVATEDGDLYGDGVNVASRIQAAGEPGEVWVSEDVRRQLRQRPEFRFASRGERELKGLKRPLAMHAVEIQDKATWKLPDPKGAPTVAGKRNGGAAPPTAGKGGGLWTRRRAISLLGAGILVALVAIGASTWFSGRGSDANGSDTVLAVLPFENLSGDEATEPFVLGVHDDLLTQLSRLGAFRVISRTTVMGYEGSTKSVPEIARELGATTVLEGGIQRSGDRIRMNVQLIDARTDEHLWAEQFDRTLTAGDVFAIQAEISERIASQLAAALTPEQKADLAPAPTDDLDALDLYYQGLAFYRGRGGGGRENARRAASSLAAAVEADPEFAAAWAALAQAHAWQIRTGVETDTTGARQALDEAIALAPQARETRLAEGVYFYYGKADFRTADERFEAMISRWPDDAELLAWRAMVVRRTGRWSEALELAERARALDPRNLVVLSYLGEIFQSLRRFDEAERTWDQILSLNPRFGTARYWKTLLLLRGRGDIARARRFTGASADVLEPTTHAALSATVSLFERDYAAATQTWSSQPFDPDNPSEAYGTLAISAHFAGHEKEAIAWADSLEAVSTREIEELESGLDPFVQRALEYARRGISHAISGRADAAREDARHALEIFPLQRDEVDGPPVHMVIATVFILVGDRDAAFNVLDGLASGPAGTYLTAAGLRLDPRYDPLRDDPRYPALVRKLEEAERSGSGTL